LHALLRFRRALLSQDHIARLLEYLRTARPQARHSENWKLVTPANATVFPHCIAYRNMAEQTILARGSHSKPAYFALVIDSQLVKAPLYTAVNRKALLLPINSAQRVQMHDCGNFFFVRVCRQASRGCWRRIPFCSNNLFFCVGGAAPSVPVDGATLETHKTATWHCYGQQKCKCATHEIATAIESCSFNYFIFRNRIKESHLWKRNRNFYYS